MKNDESIDKLRHIVGRIARYRVVLFCVVIATVYAFLLLQINLLSNRKPSTNDASTSSTTARVPHIDPAVLKQLESLQDNSVNVKTLFDGARSNPFQE